MYILELNLAKEERTYIMLLGSAIYSGLLVYDSMI
jgi:hypothetical protein